MDFKFDIIFEEQIILYILRDRRAWLEVEVKIPNQPEMKKIMALVNILQGFITFLTEFRP